MTPGMEKLAEALLLLREEVRIAKDGEHALREMLEQTPALYRAVTTRECAKCAGKGRTPTGKMVKIDYGRHHFSRPGEPKEEPGTRKCSMCAGVGRVQA